MSEHQNTNTPRTFEEVPNVARELIEKLAEQIREDVRGRPADRLGINPVALFMREARGDEGGIQIKMLPLEDFMSPEGKDALEEIAPKLAEDAEAQVVILLNESWSLREDAPKEIWDQVQAGELLVSETDYKSTVLLFTAQSNGGGSAAVMYPYDPEERTLAAKPSFSTFETEEPIELQARWQFFPQA